VGGIKEYGEKPVCLNMCCLIVFTAGLSKVRKVISRPLHESRMLGFAAETSCDLWAGRRGGRSWSVCRCHTNGRTLHGQPLPLPYICCNDYRLVTLEQFKGFISEPTFLYLAAATVSTLGLREDSILKLRFISAKALLAKFAFNGPF